MQEVGWTVMRWKERRRGDGEERSVVAPDGSVQGAEVEAEGLLGARAEVEGDVLGIGGKFVLATVGLSLWMILMTAIYFHTWFEKVSLTSVHLETPLLVLGVADLTVVYWPSHGFPGFIYCLHSPEMGSGVEMGSRTAWRLRTRDLIFCIESSSDVLYE